MPLPKVRDGTLASMVQNTANPEWVDGKIKELAKENPLILRLLVQTRENHGPEAAATAHLVYCLLESQLEAEEMNEA